MENFAQDLASSLEKWGQNYQVALKLWLKSLDRNEMIRPCAKWKMYVLNEKFGRIFLEKLIEKFGKCEKFGKKVSKS